MHALSPMVLIACGVLVSPQDVGLSARLRELENTLVTHYRGESLDAALERVSRSVQVYNERARQLQEGGAAERQRLDKLLQGLNEERALLGKKDNELRAAGGSRSDQVARLEERNTLVRRINETSTRVNAAVEAYNRQLRKGQEALEAERVRVVRDQEQVNARLAAFERFTSQGEDVTFFCNLNRLLADVRGILRVRPEDAMAQLALAKVRSFRRELAEWAQANQDRQINGLILVEATVEDEPCWFIVDTGAMDTVISEEIMDAIGCRDLLGKQTSLSVVGGLRVTGLSCYIPRLQAAGRVRNKVAGIAVRPADVGIDGLLGQSFLGAFRVILDRKAAKGGRLVLEVRP